MDNKLKVVLAAALILRLVFWATAPVTADACLHFSIAKHMAEDLSVPTFEYFVGQDPYWWPPLFHIATAAVYKVTGALTITPLIFGAAGLIVFYIFCRRFYPKHAATATIILSFLPFHTYYSAIGYVDTLIFTLSVASYYFYYSFRQDKNKKNLLYAAAAAGLSAATHYNGLIPFLAISAHMLLKDRKNAPTFIAAAALLSCPWYIRNTVVFGNPIWPKVYGGYYPAESAVMSMTPASMVANVINPGRWATALFDFWLGAPNSGEDIVDNVEVAKNRYPLFELPLVAWFISILWLSMLAADAARKDWKNMMFPALVLIFCLIPFSSNGLARMFTSAIPFAVIAMAKGYDNLSSRFKKPLLAVTLATVLIASYAYANTYQSMRAPYQPFFNMMRDEITDNKSVIMPFNMQECIYYSERICERVGSRWGIPRPTESNIDELLKAYDISYVCCTSMNWNAQSENDRMICEHFKNQPPTIKYEKDGVWGSCYTVR